MNSSKFRAALAWWRTLSDNQKLVVLLVAMSPLLIVSSRLSRPRRYAPSAAEQAAVERLLRGE